MVFFDVCLFVCLFRPLEDDEQTKGHAWRESVEEVIRKLGQTMRMDIRQLPRELTDLLIDVSSY